MQTIKIYLKESGSVAELVKDFNLYAGSYQNKLLDVYVPTGILYTATNIDNGVKVGGLLIAPNGSQITTKSYYLNFVRNEKVFNEFEQKDIEYAVYERLLPKEFTLFSGDQKIVTNVVAIDNTDEVAVIKQIVTTQTATMVVNESSYLDEEQPVEPSELDIVNAKVSENSRDIVDLQGRMTTAELNIMTNAQEISKNAQEIKTIKEQYTQPEDYVGQMTGTIAPTQQQLTQFVIDVEGRQPKNADVIIFILRVEGETDKNYKYIYSTNGWNGYEIPPMETSKNGELGLIEGTFNIGSNNDTIVDIVGGQIVNIYVKDSTGTLRNVQEYSNTLKSSIDNIISGKTQVGKSLKATQDGLGNNIANTYLTKNDGATKDYVKDYALPKQFSDVSYISEGGYSANIPNISFDVTSNSVGSTQLFDITKTAGAKYQLSNKNSYDNVVFIGASANCTVEFRLTTKIKDKIANVEVNDNVSLNAGAISRITFHDNLDYLGSYALNVEDTDTIEQILEVITSTSEEITFTVYSNSIYPSKFYLNIQSMIVTTSVSDVLSLDSQQMDNYVKNGGLPQDKLAICNEVIADGYLEGGLYRFNINYPDTYSWVLLNKSHTVTNIEQEKVEVNTFDGKVFLSEAEYTELVDKGQIEIDGQIIKYSDNAEYITPDTSYSIIQGIEHPNKGTEGEIGQLYLDVNGKNLYQCVGKQNNNYEWQNVGYGSNPNLLINGDFRVNQRGQTLYERTSGRVYTVDRWGIWSNNCTFNAETKTLTNLVTSGNAIMSQYIEDSEALFGKTLTLSVNINNTIHTVTGTIANSYDNFTSDTVIFIKEIKEMGVLIAYIRAMWDYSRQKIRIDIGCTPTGKNITIKYAKLEVGSVATEFSPRPYADELAMCQRYYQRIRVNGAMGFVANVNVLYSGIQLIQTMRATPSVTNEVQTSVREIGKGIKGNVDLVFNYLYDNILQISADTSSLGLTEYSGCVLVNGTLVLEAEF